MKHILVKNRLYLKVLILFLVLINFSIVSMAGTGLSDRLGLLEKRFGAEFETNIITLIVLLLVIFLFIFIVLFTVIFINKIPRKLAYCIIVISFLIISIISILYGEEISTFSNMIIKYQMDLVNNTYNIL